MGKSKPTVFEQVKDDQPNRTVRGLNTSTPLRWLIIVVSVVAVGAFFPGRSGDVQRNVFDASILGTQWTEETVYADYAFPVEKPLELYNRQCDSARKMAPTVFREVQGARDRARVKLTQAVAAIETGLDSTVGFSDGVRRALSNADASIRREAVGILRSHGNAVFDAAYSSGIVSVGLGQLAGTTVIVRLDNTTERVVAIDDVSDTLRIALMLDARIGLTQASSQSLAADVLKWCAVPSLSMDSKATEQMRQTAAMSVPRTIDIVRAGDVIVRKGDRVTEVSLARLASYRDAQYLRSDSQFSPFVVVGSLTHAAMIVTMLVLYLALLRKPSFESNTQLASLLSLPVATAAMAWASVSLPTEIPLEYAILLPALSMLVSVLFEARTAFVTTVVLALVVSGVRGNDYGSGLVLLVSGTLAAYSTNTLQSRTQIFTSILAILLGMLVGILGIDLERATAIERIWPKLVVGSVNAVVSPLATFAIIILMERFANVATDLRLEEYDNLSHPLLTELAEHAPGSYQHTLAVARLAEAAAAAIGANALLAKVGALFHDVGKLEKAEYFVENQIDIDNKHDKLPPKRSAAIIRQHVQDGIDLAKRSGLPERIWKFIPMHHGTILIKHFYAKALDETLLKETVVDEQDYRYPGPKPDSRETAIVMLADASEALSRLVDTSSREELEEAVERIVMDRLKDGQLSEAPLTTQELAVIQESFVRNLLGSSHQRVRYKEVSETTDTPEP
jgi:hypothetical protein